jgi:threonine aldolase
MIHFECDYTQGAHPKIIEMLAETNMEQTTGYGEDGHCERARQMILEKCRNKDAYVQFLVGGTQANTTVIAAALRPWQGVISADTGHINVHETGAIEATGHKVIALPNKDGKIAAEQIDACCREHFSAGNAEHMVQPGMVYVSNPTEYGTLYTKTELESIRKVCSEYDLILFVDGARMAYGLGAEGNDLTLADYAAISDVFYIGGTKAGALFGEAVVITDERLKKDFRYMIKRQGGMLAKGRLLGIQYEVLMEDDLYTELGRHANVLAAKIKEAFLKKGYESYMDSVTNQQFFILPLADLEKLGEKYSYSFERNTDATHALVRFCTSWATTEEQVNELLLDVAAL